MGFLKDTRSNINALLKAVFSPPTHPSSHATQLALHAHNRHTWQDRARQQIAQPLKCLPFPVLCSLCGCSVSSLDDGGNKVQWLGLALILMNDYDMKVIGKPAEVHIAKVIFSNTFFCK